jgi:hypothetical protein
MGGDAVSEPDSNSRDTGEFGAVHHRIEVIDRQLWPAALDTKTVSPGRGLLTSTMP